MLVLRKMIELADSPRDKASTWLLIGAIFFAMRSCEYLTTAAEESKRTKILRLRNISFKRRNKQLKHGSKVLHLADLVQIRFEFQKNDKRDIIVHMFRSGDNTLCPVIAWAKTIRRVRAIPGSSEDSKVCLFKDNKGNISFISGNYVRSRLRAVVTLLGEEELGFTKDDVGLHSIRSGGAMAMFLSGTSAIIIQRVGRWSSEAFLEYIREQVESFTIDVSRNMLKYEKFLNLSNDQSKESENIIQNEDGPDFVPFRIKFSELSLGGDPVRQKE